MVSHDHWHIPQGLLETHLADQPFSSAELLSDYLRLFQANTDTAVVKMLQVKLLIPVSNVPTSNYLLCSMWLNFRYCKTVLLEYYLNHQKFVLLLHMAPYAETINFLECLTKCQAK